MREYLQLFLWEHLHDLIKFLIHIPLEVLVGIFVCRNVCGSYVLVGSNVCGSYVLVGSQARLEAPFQ